MFVYGAVARILRRAVRVATVIIGAALIGSVPAGVETDAVEGSLASQHTTSNQDIHPDVSSGVIDGGQIYRRACIRAVRCVVGFRVSRYRISICLYKAAHLDGGLACNETQIATEYRVAIAIWTWRSRF